MLVITATFLYGYDWESAANPLGEGRGANVTTSPAEKKKEEEKKIRGVVIYKYDMM